MTFAEAHDIIGPWLSPRSCARTRIRRACRGAETRRSPVGARPRTARDVEVQGQRRHADDAPARGRSATDAGEYWAANGPHGPPQGVRSDSRWKVRPAHGGEDASTRSTVLARQDLPPTGASMTSALRPSDGPFSFARRASRRRRDDSLAVIRTTARALSATRCSYGGTAILPPSS